MIGRKLAAALMSSEDSIQRALVDRWRWLGAPGSILAHLPNGGFRNKATAGRMRAQGVLPGVPDLLIGSPASGLAFMELKRRGGRLSPAQREVHAILRGIGVEVLTLDDLDTAIAALEARGVIRGKR